MTREGPAIRLEAMAEAARRLTSDPFADHAGFETALDRLAEDLPRPAEDGPLIGFDRPATVYVASGLDPFTSAPAILTTLIASRPWERHIVLFTRRFEGISAAKDRVRRAGGFALAPDPSLGLHDRWLWLSAKLAAYAAQRVVVLAAAQDVAARVAARQLAPRYGRRLYVLHQDDSQPCLADGALAGATHLAFARTVRNHLKALAPALPVGMLTIPFAPERRLPPRPLPVPPPAPGPGRRAALRWRVARLKWRLRWLKIRVQRRVARSPLAGAVWQAQLLLARLRLVRGGGQTVTATAGREAEFTATGPLAFGAVVAEVLQATGGRHLHIGPVGLDFRIGALKALTAAGIASDRLVFLTDETQIATAFARNRIDAMLGSFPRAEAVTRIETAWTGLPQAHHAPALGSEAAAPGSLLWRTPKDLAQGIGGLTGTGPRDRLRRAIASHRWQAACADPARLSRRFNAIIDVTEGQLARPLTATERAAARAAPFEAGPPVAFDPGHYLNGLPAAARAVAEADAFAHYLARGEALGHPPHPLFDPVLCARSLARTPGVTEAEAAANPQARRSVLGRYLVAGGTAQPHQFFDPAHYLRQLDVPPQDRPLLVDFLLAGAKAGCGPHPLVEPGWLSQGNQAGFAGDFLAWLTGRLPDSRQGHPLFNPGEFRASDPENRFGPAAPNLLWAHVIEGNLSRRHPHPLIWPAEVEKTRPGTLTGATTVLELIARNRMGKANPHPLVDTGHILAQAPWLAQTGRHPLRHFLESGAAENIDPHPWFSTQFYFYTCPDVARAGVNPLMHYLSHGATEGRWPHGFFNGRAYFKTYLKDEDGQPALLDYAQRGAGLFWNALELEDGLRRLTMKTAQAQFALEARHPAETAASGAADLLRIALHPETGVAHPTLLTESRPLRSVTPDPGRDLRERLEIAPAETVRVLRPSVVAPRHITPPSGQYVAPAIDVGLYPEATVVAGNDGFLTASGIWQDHGLASFDPETMEPKGNAAVFAVAGDRVLLRRHKGAESLPAGIFCCGSYSRNYYHFLIETLPRALFAAELAPPGTPVLTDDDMPDQHYQALRLMLPDHPILRLARHRSYRVDRLYAASMPNTFQDAFLKPEVPADAVRIHPVVQRRLADLAARLHPVDGAEAAANLPRRLFLSRRSRWRQLLNADALEFHISARGFTTVDFGAMSFTEQIRHMAHAEAVVGQSGAHFANLVFARPGTRAFPLFSNAPGTNFNLWPSLGTPLGIEVINVAGWRVPGSTGGAAPAAHEHFTVPPHLVAAYFPLPETPKKPVHLLDALLAAGPEADALSSAWAIQAGAPPEGFEDRLLDLRRQALKAIAAAPDDKLEKLLAHPLFADPWSTLKSGLRALLDHDPAERATISGLEAAFARLAQGKGSESPADLRRLMLQAMLLLPAWRLPLIAAPEALPADVRAHYLRWIALPPFLFRPGEDEGYVAHAARLLGWIDRQLAPDRPEALRNAVARMASELDLGQLLLIEAPLTDVFAARNRVLDRIAVRQGQARRQPRAADGSEGRIRVGILCRTFDKGPDSEAVVAMFRAFDRTRFEVFAYSVGFQDRVVSADSAFDREFDAAIDHRRLLPGDATELRAQILADDLDVFLFANATTYGLKAMELALYHRVAPVQAVMNSHLPMSLGFPSFDAYITGLSDHADHDVPQGDFPERLVRVKGPVISYLTSLKPRSNPPLNRASLGLDPDDIVVMNAGSFQKLRHECLLTMMRAVRDVPRGVLLLAPYNPGWAARAQAFAFNRQLTETAAEAGLDMSRIRILSEMTVAEAEAALSCADIYLSPFPHGGATMTHLALIYGIPPVTLRRRSPRSIDQFLIESLGFPELLADTPADYIALVQALAADAPRRRALAEAVRQAARHPVFVDNPEYSRDMERAVEGLLAEARIAVAQGERKP